MTNLAEGTHSLMVAARDQAGNLGSGSQALLVTVDTTAPNTPLTPDLLAASDSGSDSGDNITQQTSQLMLTVMAEAGATAVLYDNGTSIGQTLLDTDGAGGLSVDLNPGAHTLTVKATDSAGNTSGASGALTVQVDTTAPNAPNGLDLATASDSGSDDASMHDNRTNITENLEFFVTSEAGAVIRLLEAKETLGQATADSTGVATLHINLGKGSHDLYAQAEDSAGNVSSASTILTVSVDSTLPPQPKSPETSGTTDTLNAAYENLMFTVTASAGSTVVLYNGANALHTADADATTGVASFQVNLPDPGTSIGTYTLTARELASNGSLSPASGDLVVHIDTVAPAAPGLLALNAGTDTGTPGDSLTHRSTDLGFTISAEAHSTVILYNGTESIAEATADSSGVAHPIAATLAEGTHSLHAQTRDRAGNLSATSAPQTFTVDTTAPTAPPAPSGPNSVTNTSGPLSFTLSGTAGHPVTVFHNGLDVGTVTLEASGTAMFSLSPGHGIHTFNTRLADAAGNISAASDPLVVTVDTQAPNTPPAPTLVASSDSGSSNSDAITRKTTDLEFTLRGTPGSTLTLFNAMTSLSQAVANGDGEAMVRVDLPHGTHNLSVQATDTAGNDSPHSQALTVTVDTTPPRNTHQSRPARLLRYRSHQRNHGRQHHRRKHPRLSGHRRTPEHHHHHRRQHNRRQHNRRCPRKHRFHALPRRRNPRRATHRHRRSRQLLLGYRTPDHHRDTKHSQITRHTHPRHQIRHRPIQLRPHHQLPERSHLPSLSHKRRHRRPARRRHRSRTHHRQRLGTSTLL